MRKRQLLSCLLLLQLLLVQCTDNPEKKITENGGATIKLMAPDSSFIPAWQQFAKAFAASDTAALQSICNGCIISTGNPDTTVSLKIFLDSLQHTGILPEKLKADGAVRFITDSTGFNWQLKHSCICGDTGNTKPVFAKGVLQLPAKNKQDENNTYVFCFIKKQGRYQFFEVFSIP